MIFRWPVRVYYEDTDAAGVVYYANYLRFLERARTEWLASLGFTLTALEAEHGVVFVVHRLDIEYRQPARLYDALEVTLVPRVTFPDGHAETFTLAFEGHRCRAVERVESPEAITARHPVILEAEYGARSEGGRGRRHAAQ